MQIDRAWRLAVVASTDYSDGWAERRGSAPAPGRGAGRARACEGEVSQLGLLVTDASPLITLAATDALECLTMPGLRVVVPDMVYFEVTQDLARTGAENVVQWARRHRRQVQLSGDWLES